MKMTVAVLSGFCVIAVLGIGGWYSGILTGDGLEQVKDVKDVLPENISTKDASDEIKRMAAEQEAVQSSIKDFSTEKNDEDSAKPENSGADNGITPEPTGNETTIDAPVSDIHGDTGELTAYDEVWGGCYMDENSCWVVWLTEDTPENREMVFALNPSLNENNTIFKTAAYSKAYLTDLMARISGAMGTGKLPFVTTAALREDKNCIEVTMNSDDPYISDQILAFDTIGGAIEIIYSSEQMVQDYFIIDLIKDPEP